MPEPITTLGLAKTTSDIIKEAMSFARDAKNTDLAEKLIDLYRDFVLLVETNQELRNENQELKSELTDLKKRPDVADKLRFEINGGSYFLELEEGKKDGPFCNVCWDVDGRLVHQRQAFGMPLHCGYCAKTTRPRK